MGKPVGAVLFIWLTILIGGEAIARQQNPSTEDRAQQILKDLSLQEKVSLLSGKNFWQTKDIPRLGVTSLELTDGPHGVKSSMLKPYSVFPTGTTMGATWNPELIYRVAEAIAKEARDHGAHVVLGPCMNIHRNPLGGRNFESFSEDPYLTGELALAYVRGLQSQGIGASAKHFVANNQETKRQSISVEVSERALREIYLPGFKKVIQEGKPWTVMAAYNAVNGVHLTEHKALLRHILRDEWGFQGVLLSDWGAMKSGRASLVAGLDLEMWGPGRYYDANLARSISWNLIPESLLNESVLRILRMVLHAQAMEEQFSDQGFDPQGHRQLSRAVASEGIVLLKNDGLLPLQKKSLNKVALIGPNARSFIFQGGGSSKVFPGRQTSALAALTSLVGPDVEVIFEGGTPHSKDVSPIDPDLLFPKIPEYPDEDSVRGLKGAYFSDLGFKGELVRSTIDGSFIQGGTQVPVAGRAPFRSVRWTGYLRAPVEGMYRFGFGVGFGKGQIVIDGQTLKLDRAGIKFHQMIPGEKVGDFYLEEGFHPITIEYEHRLPLWMQLALGSGLYHAIDNYSLSLSMRLPEFDFERAVSAASEADIAIVVVGGGQIQESEFQDRSSMSLYGRQDELVTAVAEVNPRTVVAVNSGAPVLMPWVNEVPAVLMAWLSGQEGAVALMDIVFGITNPSGKLPMTMPRRYADHPSSQNFPGGRSKVHYAEDILVGYRAFDTHGIEPLFPFGHGLSYSSFEYSNGRIQKISERGEYRVTVTLRNQGDRAGSETVQLYVSDHQSSVMRPAQELKAFKKVDLGPGEVREVDFILGLDAFQFFHPKERHWMMESGEFTVKVGGSSKEAPIRLLLVI